MSGSIILDEIFKVVLLDNGNRKSYFVFTGDSFETINALDIEFKKCRYKYLDNPYPYSDKLSSIFTETDKEILGDTDKDISVKFINRRIFIDDTIVTITKKIAMAIPELPVEFMYLFVNVNDDTENISPIPVSLMTNSNKGIVNPYNEHSQEALKLHKITLQSTEIKLLVQVNKIIEDNVIFLCTLENVRMSVNKEVSDLVILQTYFPLFTKTMLSGDDDIKKIIKEVNARQFNPKNVENNAVIQNDTELNAIYNNYFNGRSSVEDVNYIKVNCVLTDVVFSINPVGEKKTIPIKNLFLLLHADKENPLIKVKLFNVADSQYRLYAPRNNEQFKESYLSQINVEKYDKLMTTAKCVSVLIINKIKDIDYPIICEFHNDCSIIIKLTNVAGCDDNEINAMMIDLVNPVIKKVKTYLDANGNNTMSEFTKITHSNIELLTTNLILISDMMNGKDGKDGKDSKYLKNLKDRMSISFKQGVDDIMRYTRVSGYSEPNNQVNPKLSLGRQNAAPNTTINPTDVKEVGFETYLTAESRMRVLKLAVYGITSFKYITVFKIWFNELLYYKKPKINQKKVIIKQSVVAPIATIVEIPPLQQTANSEVEKSTSNDIKPVDNENPPVKSIIEAKLINKPKVNTAFASDSDDEGGEGGGEGEGGDVYGGAKTKKPARVRNKKSDEPVEKLNDFLSKIQRLDPGLFANEGNEDMSSRYSRECQWNWHRQPVVLTNEQKNKIDKKDVERNKTHPEHGKSYNIALQHNSQKVTKEEDKLWYICPRYWDKDTDESLTHEEVMERGEGKWDNIIPVVDKDADGSTALNGPLTRSSGTKPSIIEFIDYKRIKPVLPNIHPDNFIYDKNGNQIKNKEFMQRFPGFLEPPNEGPCKPCCFTVDEKNRLTVDNAGKTVKINKWSKGKQQKDREQCINSVNITEPVVAKPPESEKEQVNSTTTTTSVKENHGEYVLGSNKIPMDTPNRLGFMPESVQHLLNIRNIDFTIPKTDKIKPGHNCILRHSIPIHTSQSFVNCISYLLSQDGFNGDVKKRILEKVTIDIFVTLHNGSILQKCYTDYITSAKPKSEEELLENYSEKIKQSLLAKNMNKQIADRQTLFKIVAAYDQFKKVINSNTENIDYEYLWEIVCNEDMLFSTKKTLDYNGINLVILHLHRNAISTFVDIICPMNHYINNISKFFNVDKRTAIILKIESMTTKGTKQFYYEPLVKYKINNSGIPETEPSPFFVMPRDGVVFHSDDALRMIASFLLYVRLNWQKSCTPKVVIKNGITAKQKETREKYYLNTIFRLIKSIKTYKYEFVSQVINNNLQVVGAIIAVNNDKTEFFVPCFPSTPMYKILIPSRHPSKKNGGKRRKRLVDFTLIYDVMNINKYAHSYSETIDFMENFSKSVSVELKYTPKHYVKEENTQMVIGIMTELDQYIPIIPFDSIKTKLLSPYIYDIKEGYNILDVDRTISTSNDIDDNRFNDVRNRRIEHKTYDVFSEIVHRVIKQGHKPELDELLSDKVTWYTKLDDVKREIKKWTKQYVKFITDDAELKKIIEKKNVEILACLDCLTNNTGLCKDKASRTVCRFNIPKINLIDPNIDNSDEYYTRVSDDIIRNRRVGAFMGIQSSNTYSNIELNVNDDELLFSKEAMNKYFMDLKLRPLRIQFNNTYKTGIPSDNNQSNDKRIDLNEFRPEKRTINVPIGRVIL